MTSQNIPRKIRAIWPPLLLGAAALGYTIWAQDYGKVARLMPTVVGAVTILLCLLDMVSRLDNRVGRALQIGLGADFNNREMTHDPTVRSELMQIGWMIGCIVAFLLIGILPTIPLFITGYMILRGKQPWLASLISGLVVLGFVVVVFEILLDYRLYRGVLLGAEGLGLW
ncbi:tripartite tricarboxylate transporter TctB family protein [Puniceibacterium sp. IMCC21224]|uniref:tripartite tricarboxylate transporter TctB family protein n=1 Tax=Puniceibacterium sp. IMCC21224 TaxID=1618204 RepID=UPI00064DE2A8|nr:tripartite tricarboxylate transporter TctB family protein [Puniceibacterium sp. IMCC21224]KMK65037.1 Tripartite tricarboxylate transporter TctB family [Puniceibacterium sp. IMCC21224]